MSATGFLVLLIVSIAILMVLIMKVKLHPTFALFLSALFMGLVLGRFEAEGFGFTDILTTITGGFGGTLGSMGIPIMLGAILAMGVQDTGAAKAIANSFIKLFRGKNLELAPALTAYIVSIPVFCDSGYVILNPIRKAIVKKTGVSAVAMAVALSAGLYTSHVFIPPTPGPIAAAQSLGLESHMLMVILVGFLVSIPSLAAGYFYARYIGKKVHAADEDSSETTKSYDELKAEFGQLPGAGISFAPIVMPIILMAVKSIVDMAKWTGLFAQILQFLGTPMIALTVGLIISVATLFSAGKGKEFYALADETLRTVGPILFVTAAGGVLGKVISDAGIVTYITEHASFLSNVGIFFPFIIAAILKTAQGSSTVAITTTAGILGLYSAEGSLMSALGLTSPFAAALTVMAIGAGAMTVSHANDSYFWVVTNFGGMKAEDGYKTQTMCTLLMGLASIVFIWIISLFFH